MQLLQNVQMLIDAPEGKQCNKSRAEWGVRVNLTYFIFLGNM